MANYTPETPGSEVEFDKPNIPNCWGVQPIVNVANTPTVTVGNAEANPVPTKEVTTT